jgi:hypothetical protein
MGLATGFKIEQTIVRDPRPASVYSKADTIVFNVQILNASSFEQSLDCQLHQLQLTRKLMQTRSSIL